MLCWVAGKAYSWFHGGLLGNVGSGHERPIFEYLTQLEQAGYPYDLLQLRYSIGGDNGPPDPNLPEFVKGWNDRYAHPKMRIATTTELFRDLERRYGPQIPEVRGDFTPYWEDGAGSSALETAVTRTAAERLVQAETLWTLVGPKPFPAAAFSSAWRQVILYNEHTWGAHCSISKPDSQFTKDQWKIKQAFALAADEQSRRLLAEALVERRATGSPTAVIDVYNTASWPRSDLVVLPAELAVVGERVTQASGAPVASQRLANGQLAFWAADIPPLGAKRFQFAAGAANEGGSAKAEGNTLSNEHVRLVVDGNRGAIGSLTAEGIPGDLVDQREDLGLNDYLYVASRDPKDIHRNQGARIAVRDRGPLVASLLVESSAPGCRQLSRELRVIAGTRRVEITNVVDKEQIRTKEAVHFGFPFNVPGGEMRLDIPWATIRPELDQLPGACRNYLSIGRWIDVSNHEYGVTWATLDAPLVEIGAIRVDVTSPFDSKAWLQHLEPSQTFYSYVMNNYWETNYKASQQGPTPFRYALEIHGRFDPAAPQRFGIERSQPLIAVPADPESPVCASLLSIDPVSVIVTSLKPAADGKAYLLRLFNTADQAAAARLRWPEPAPVSVFRSDPAGHKGPQVTGTLELPPRGIATLLCSTLRAAGPCKDN